LPPPFSARELYTSTRRAYADGYAEELTGLAIRQAGVPAERIFITSKVWPNHLRFEDVLRSCAGSLRRLRTEYIDLYLIHWPAQLIPLRETFRALNQLVRDGRVRHIGVSNFTLRLLKQAHRLAESPLVTNQVHYSIYDRSYVRNGVLAYCQEHDILLTAYSPLEAGRLRLHPILQTIAEELSATPYQVALAWLTTQPRVIAIPSSFDPRHQAENLAAADLTFSPSQMDRLNQL
jgi:diketogulonate reductase-like aldo/keto reductase